MFPMIGRERMDEEKHQIPMGKKYFWLFGV